MELALEICGVIVVIAGTLFIVVILCLIIWTWYLLIKL